MRLPLLALPCTLPLALALAAFSLAFRDPMGRPHGLAPCTCWPTMGWAHAAKLLSYKAVTQFMTSSVAAPFPHAVGPTLCTNTPGGLLEIHFDLLHLNIAHA